MVKATKFLRKQAAKAERVALTTADEETSKEMLTLASAYRAQADVLKQKMKAPKERPRLTRKSPRMKSGSLAANWSHQPNDRLISRSKVMRALSE
jgi:hypothetical protein